MYFDSLQALLVMDGHGAYVWTAYLVSIVVIALALVVPVRRRNAFLQQLSAERRRAHVDTRGQVDNSNRRDS